MGLMWVTGTSGTGKTTVCNELRSRGFDCEDSDDRLSAWHRRGSREVVAWPEEPRPRDWNARHGWFVRRELLEQLHATSVGRTFFVCGSFENQREVLDLFDGVIALVVDSETLRQRYARRDGADVDTYTIPPYLAGYNDDLPKGFWALGARLVDSTRPVAQVADDVIAAGAAIAGRRSVRT